MRNDFSPRVEEGLAVISRHDQMVKSPANAVVMELAQKSTNKLSGHTLPQSSKSLLGGFFDILGAAVEPRVAPAQNAILVAGATPTRPTGQKVAPGMQLNS